MSLNRVLVAIDIAGPNADALLTQASRLVPTPHVLQLLYVIDDPLYLSTDSVIADDGQLEERRTLAEQQLRELAIRHNVDHVQVAFGHPASIIHQLAADRAVDLVIVGSHGRHGWRLLLGSTATAVLRGTPCNVLAVWMPDGSDAERLPRQPGYRRILAAVDISDDTQSVVDEAVRLANLHDAELGLVSVVRPPNLLAGAGNAALERDGAQLLDRMHDQIRLRLTDVAVTHALPSDSVFTPIGDPVAEIHRLSGDWQADLVVVGTHGVHGLHVILGSTAKGIMHGQTCDVLAVRLRAPTKGMSVARRVQPTTAAGLEDREHVSLN